MTLNPKTQTQNQIIQRRVPVGHGASASGEHEGAAEGSGGNVPASLHGVVLNPKSYTPNPEPQTQNPEP